MTEKLRLFCHRIISLLCAISGLKINMKEEGLSESLSFYIYNRAYTYLSTKDDKMRDIIICNVDEHAKREPLEVLLKK